MDTIDTAQEWAEKMFGQADLGDRRRTSRLVHLARDLAIRPELSVDAASVDSAAAEGAHRFVRNDSIEAEAIAQAGFAATAKIVEETSGWVLAIQDSTGLSFDHSVAGQLGDMGGAEEARKQGWWVHSTLAVDASSSTPLGLLDQHRWARSGGERGKKHRRTKRLYHSKESYKWEAASRRIASQVSDDARARMISVCDRESDIYEYLSYNLEHGQHFVVRACRDRVLRDTPAGRLWKTVQAAPRLGERQVRVRQRGGKNARPERRVIVGVSACPVRFQPTKRRVGPRLGPIDLWAVYVAEIDPGGQDQPLEWLLLTDFECSDLASAEQVIGHYETRWMIEDFHRAWKSGTRVEERRQQEASNLEKVAVITAFVAIRLLQLRSIAANDPTASCQTVFTEVQWWTLWAGTEKSQPPARPPTIQWAWLALARLGGWHDTARTGRPGWVTLWRGWSRLEERVNGIELARRFPHPLM